MWNIYCAVPAVCSGSSIAQEFEKAVAMTDEARPGFLGAFVNRGRTVPRYGSMRIVMAICNDSNMLPCDSVHLSCGMQLLNL